VVTKAEKLTPQQNSQIFFTSDYTINFIKNNTLREIERPQIYMARILLCIYFKKCRYNKNIMKLATEVLNGF